MARVEAGKLELDRVVPLFSLPSMEGEEVSVGDYKQKANLVLAYLDLDRCGGCIDLLREFADNYSAYRDLETEVLAICPQSPSDLKSRLGDMGLPFPVLSDQQGELARVYLGGEPGQGPVGTVFVTDRFGALQTRMVADSEGELPNQASILDWLSLIEMQCPECGTGVAGFQP